MDSPPQPQTLRTKRSCNQPGEYQLEKAGTYCRICHLIHMGICKNTLHYLHTLKFKNHRFTIRKHARLESITQKLPLTLPYHPANGSEHTNGMADERKCKICNLLQEGGLHRSDERYPPNGLKLMSKLQHPKPKSIWTNHHYVKQNRINAYINTDSHMKPEREVDRSKIQARRLWPEDYK